MVFSPLGTTWIDSQTSVRSKRGFRKAGLTYSGSILMVRVVFFDPEDIKQMTKIWLPKVNELRRLYDDWWCYSVICLVELHRMVDVWYKGATSTKFTWREWKDKIIAAFPLHIYYQQIPLWRYAEKDRILLDESYTRYPKFVQENMNPLDRITRTNPRNSVRDLTSNLGKK